MCILTVQGAMQQELILTQHSLQTNYRRANLALPLGTCNDCTCLCIGTLGYCLELPIDTVELALLNLTRHTYIRDDYKCSYIDETKTYISRVIWQWSSIAPVVREIVWQCLSAQENLSTQTLSNTLPDTLCENVYLQNIRQTANMGLCKMNLDPRVCMK